MNNGVKKDTILEKIAKNFNIIIKLLINSKNNLNIGDGECNYGKI